MSPYINLTIYTSLYIPKYIPNLHKVLIYLYKNLNLSLFNNFPLPICLYRYFYSITFCDPFIKLDYLKQKLQNNLIIRFNHIYFISVRYVIDTTLMIYFSDLPLQLFVCFNALKLNVSYVIKTTNSCLIIKVRVFLKSTKSNQLHC